MGAAFAGSGTPLLANMTEFGAGPLVSLDDLASCGFTAVLYPVTLLRLAMKAMEAGLAVLAAVTFVAAAVNSVAGGGTILTFPALTAIPASRAQDSHRWRSTFCPLLTITSVTVASRSHRSHLVFMREKL